VGFKDFLRFTVQGSQLSVKGFEAFMFNVLSSRGGSQDLGMGLWIRV
jgi:hypothetical protein